MKEKAIKKVIGFILLFLISSIVSCCDKADEYPEILETSNNGSVQSDKPVYDQSLPPKPNMWVNMLTGVKRESNFFEKHHLTLSKYLGKAETISLYYPIADFKKMIENFEATNYESLRVTICNKSNLLFLVYSPLSKQSGITYYDPITPNKPLSSTTVNAWVKDYLKKPFIGKSKMNILTSMLEKNDEKNYDENDNFYNTKMIHFSRQDIDELISEVTYQDTACGNKVTGIKATFSAFGRDGKEYGPCKGQYKGRIFVQFDFTKLVGGKDEVFYIDTTSRFNERRPSDRAEIDCNGILDNGQLCPANCPR